ncbi:MAG TPA: hypothetical protein VL987_05255, partial [Cellvibrio sp.]|nr:hypothetical protein [Cellvibrio sp.]
MNTFSRFRNKSRPPSHLISLLCFLALLTSLFCQFASAQQSGYTVTSSSSVRFYVNGAPWADIHY